MTIYEIKSRTLESSPHYFARTTLKFFGQTLKMFSVWKMPDGRYRIAAPMVDRFTRKQVGTSVRYFNPDTNRLERE